MSHTPSSDSQQIFEFLKGKDNVIDLKNDSEFDWNKSAEIVRVHISEATNARNIVFLLGSGCSSLKIEGKEVGIPTMKPMADEFFGTQGDENDEIYLTEAELDFLSTDLGIDITKADFKCNLERILEVLFGFKFVLQHAEFLPNNNTVQSAVETAIDKLKKFILYSCKTGISNDESYVIHELYQSFYRKLIYRDRSLPKPWIFTTNYDLFNESALDRLGIQYSNGFSGLVERRFNPSTFNYALGEQLDISGGKWNVVDKGARQFYGKIR